ncbi:MAG: hypothetical protein ABI689_06830 [Thermoanaerobaculia bacterium]
MDDTLSSAAPGDRWRWWGVLALVSLLAATLWAYLPILGNGFVWDDGANLIGARAKWNDGASGIVWAFTVPFNGHYQPLTWLSYRMDVLISGATPRGVHATNLALHLLATALVGALAWWFAGRTFSGPRAGTDRLRQGAATLLCAALFALHPIHVETVAWATERRDLLSTVLVLAAVLLHLRTAPADTTPSRTRGTVSLLHAFAALARAQMSLPFVLLALDLWPLGRLGSDPGKGRRLPRLVAEKSLSLAVAAISAAAAIWAQASSGALTATSEHGVLDRLVQAGYNFAFYPAALVYRSAWLPLHERPFPFEPLDQPYLLPAIVALLAIVASWALCRRWPALTVAVGSYLLFLLPVSGLAQSGIQLVAERYAYLATVPLLLLAGVAAVKLCLGPSRISTGTSGGASDSLPRSAARARILSIGAIGGIGAIAVLTLMTLATHRQTAVWHDDETLWRHVLAHSGSCLADNNLGQILFARGESGPALFHLTRALERVPLYPRPWRALAAILEAPWPEGAPPTTQVAAALARAAALSPGSTVATYASALAWRAAGDPERARIGLKKILAIEPGHDGARLALAGLDAGVRTTPSFSAPALPVGP